MGPGGFPRGLENLGHDHVVLERGQRIRLARPADDGEQVRDRVLFVGRARLGRDGVLRIGAGSARAAVAALATASARSA